MCSKGKNKIKPQRRAKRNGDEPPDKEIRVPATSALPQASRGAGASEGTSTQRQNIKCQVALKVTVTEMRATLEGRALLVGMQTRIAAGETSKGS